VRGGRETEAGAGAQAKAKEGGRGASSRPRASKEKAKGCAQPPGPAVQPPACFSLPAPAALSKMQPRHPAQPKGAAPSRAGCSGGEGETTDRWEAPLQRGSQSRAPSCRLATQLQCAKPQCALATHGCATHRCLHKLCVSALGVTRPQLLLHSLSQSETALRCRSL